MINKSPFLIVKDFISPLECERIVGAVENGLPDCDNSGRELKTVRFNSLYQKRIWEAFEDYFSYIEDWFSVEIDYLTALDVEWYPANCIQENARCENSMFIANAWKLTNNYDFTVIIFLKDYNASSNFDEEFEVYGGKLEFPNHQFGFSPQRGTAIIFPSNQYFINVTKSPEYGDLFQMRFHVVCSKRFKYDPKQFNGNYKTWFPGLT